MCNSSRLKFGQQASAKRPGEAARTGEHGEHPLVEHPQVRRCPGHNIHNEWDERSRYFLDILPNSLIRADHHKSVARARLRPWGARGAASRTLYSAKRDRSDGNS